MLLRTEDGRDEIWIVKSYIILLQNFTALQSVLLLRGSDIPGFSSLLASIKIAI
jgi:hypothetical protein